RHRPPIPAIKTVLAIVAHRKVSILWHLKDLSPIGQMSFGGVTVVAILSAHYSFETVTLRHFPIDIQLWRLDSQLVARQPRQALDVKLGLIANVPNIFRPKDKDVTPMRFNEIVTEFVYEYLITGVDRAAGDDFTASVTHSR